jgi:hypothetical protein
VVETRFVGEKEMGIAGAEIIDTKHRVVDVAEPGPTCPANTGWYTDCPATGTWFSYNTNSSTHASTSLSDTGQSGAVWQHALAKSQPVTMMGHMAVLQQLGMAQWGCEQCCFS